ncbi:hypothetical protein BRC83_04795 [Halobacteriales archaeon QS_1_68_17]|nr:MAG: hypothetical protein BRC83_04795 [Halobacteriales archaeon QS_1_68_17]
MTDRSASRALAGETARPSRRRVLAALGAAVLPGCRAPVAGPSLSAPDRTMVDEGVDLDATGVGREAVWLEARTEDGGGYEWVGRAKFAPQDGTVDPARTAPLAGSYEGVDPMGLFWSMQPERLDRPRYRRDQRTQSVALLVVPEDGGAAVAATTLDRHLAHPDSAETDVGDPVVGTLVEAPGDGPGPGVLLLHGSAGNRPVAQARVLAAHGFTVLALQYVSPDHPELPDALVEVPVEYADRAVAWLADHDATTADPVGVGGFSRGGELALLLGTRHEVGAVVNWLGAGMLFHAHVPGEPPPDTSAWSLDGDPLAAVPPAATARRGNLAAAYRDGLARLPERTVAAAEIPLDAVEAPIILISAGDDGVWPSRFLCARAAARLDAADYDHRYEHRTYDDAGHGIGVPYLPTWERSPRIDRGGTRRGTAAAEVDALPRAVAYFDRGAGR